MKSMKTKLVLSALGFALLATPAFAQRLSHRYDYAPAQNSQTGIYSNPVGRTGTAESRESGAAWDLDRGY